MRRTGIPAKCADCNLDLMYDPVAMRFYCQHCEEAGKKEGEDKKREAA